MTDVRTHRSVSGRLASILLAIVAAALALGAASPLFATTSSSPRPSSQTAAEATGEDTDNDGLTDHDEIRYHDTNPALADTDRDGILDGVEVNLYGTNPLRDDTDGDGMKDGAELRLGTDPRTPDTDRDGLVDGEELVFGTDPLNADTDGDGLPDGDEIALHGTNPLATDSDGDGLSDGDEVTRFHSDPTKQDAHRVFIHVSDNGGTDASDDLTRPVTQATKASHPLVSRVPVKMAESAPALMTLD
ncbi:MAG TPA: hypothetical protein VKZ61_07105 [Thermomicrobiales bacterium]|jgi:hypothetical protein|nr:hypothetical protein [Thermomicrobiales bacterium]